MKDMTRQQDIGKNKADEDIVIGTFRNVKHKHVLKGIFK